MLYIILFKYEKKINESKVFDFINWNFKEFLYKYEINFYRVDIIVYYYIL